MLESSVIDTVKMMHSGCGRSLSDVRVPLLDGAASVEEVNCESPLCASLGAKGTTFQN